MVTETVPPPRTRTAPRPAVQARPEDFDGSREERRRPLATRLALWVLGGTLCVALAIGFLVGLLYLRLAHSPVTADYLAAPIQSALNADLSDLSVSIKGAELRLADRGRVELSLKQVRLTDNDGLTVAIAPEAAVQLSPTALVSMRLAPTRIDLIEPRLLLFYTASQGMTLSLARPGEATVDGKQAQSAIAAAGAAAAGTAPPEQRIDLLRALADAARLTRSRASATSTLESFGLRRATVILDVDGVQSRWELPSGEISLQHRHRHSTITGQLRVSLGERPWSIAFATAASDRDRAIELVATVTDLMPSALAQSLPELASLAGWDVPVSGKARLTLSPSSELLDAAYEVNLGKGTIDPPGHRGAPAVIEKGLLKFGYSSASRRIVIEPSTIHWDASRATFVGEVRPDPTEARRWSFELATSSATLSSPEFGLEAPVQRWTAKGFVSPAAGLAKLEESVISVAGSEFRFSGEIVREGTGSRKTLDGKVGPLSAEALKAVWPRFIGAKARTWTGEHLKRGRIQAASLRYIIPPRPSEVAPSDHHGSLTLAADAGEIEIALGGSFPSVEIPKAALRIDSDNLDVTSAEARVPTAPGRVLTIKNIRLQAADIDRPDTPADISFKAVGGLQAVLDLAERESGPGMRKNAGLETADGKVDGQIRIRFPMREGLTPKDFIFEGKGRITDLRAKAVLGPYDVQGGTLGYELSEGQLDVKGDVLINGVISRLAWQHVVGMPAETQRPLVLEATLEAQDRTNLGLDVNHLLQGPVRTEVVVPRAPEGEAAPNVSVAMTLDRATLAAEALSWHKPPGRPAKLTFEIGKGRNQRVELQNLKLVAEDLAIEGSIALGPDFKPREFHFPTFSIHVIGQLEVQGRLRPDNVWDVKAAGARYDGRNAFRSLFSVGSTTQGRDQAPGRPGLDLTADIDTVLGFSELSLKRLKLRLSQRGQQIVALDASGVLDSGQPLLAQLRVEAGKRRVLLAESPDAGNTFKLTGFYPNIIGGHMNLEVDLDGRGAAQRTGILWVQNFRVLGDVIVTESTGSGEDSRPPGEVRRPRGGQRVVRQRIDFERMRVPFSVGHGQFVMHNAYVIGPLVGATVRGRLDFNTQRMSLNGTYVPLSGLNRALSGIPIIGDVLTGPRGEGVLGITFAVDGDMTNPQVTVNPLSIVAIGILREIFQMGPESQGIVPRASRGDPAATKGGPGQRPQSSSSPAIGPSGSGGTSGWSVETIPGAMRKDRP